ncbi:MAG: hypothetical protein K2Y12_08560 [Chitinophagaceae bacterium]|nr:hypothetical protein [Chitinophagaceae bacterium]
MIKEFEFYHGAVLSKIVHHRDEKIEVKTYPSTSNASYVINNDIGLYIKHSTKRLSPWRFSFMKQHQLELEDMKRNLSKVFLVLVCGHDGIVTLSYNEVKQVLDDNHGEVEWISASRTKNLEYTINGSDGGLNRKIGKSDFPRKIFSTYQ